MFLLHACNLCFNGCPYYIASYYNYKFDVTYLRHELEYLVFLDWLIDWFYLLYSRVLPEKLEAYLAGNLGSKENIKNESIWINKWEYCVYSHKSIIWNRLLGL